MKSIKKAVKYFGSNAKMAEAMGIRRDYVCKMAYGRVRISVERAIDIEKATKGHVTAKEIIHDKLQFLYDRDLKRHLNELSKLLKENK